MNAVSNTPLKPVVKREYGGEYGVGRFDLRPVADAVEQHDIGIAHLGEVVLRHVAAGSGIFGPIDKALRDERLVERADPAFAVLAALAHVIEDLPHELVAV